MSALRVKLLEHYPKTHPANFATECMDDGAWPIYSADEKQCADTRLMHVRTGVTFTLPRGFHALLVPSKELSKHNIILDPGVQRVTQRQLNDRSELIVQLRWQPHLMLYSKEVSDNVVERKLAAANGAPQELPHGTHIADLILVEQVHRGDIYILDTLDSHFKKANT